MKKREEFAVSLRKKKTHDLINAKRRKIMSQTGAQDEIEESKSSQGKGQQNSTLYSGYYIFQKDTETFEKSLSELCPLAAQAN